jgi:hypothetical protein
MNSDMSLLNIMLDCYRFCQYHSKIKQTLTKPQQVWILVQNQKKKSVIGNSVYIYAYIMSCIKIEVLFHFCATAGQFLYKIYYHQHNTPSRSVSSNSGMRSLVGRAVTCLGDTCNITDPYTEPRSLVAKHW